MLLSELKRREYRPWVPVGNKAALSQQGGVGSSHLNTTSWLTAHCLFTRHDSGEVCPVASGPWVGGSAGGWRMSLEPINSSLTKHLREISHAPLASCTENQRRGSPEEGIPYGQTGNTTQMKDNIWSLRRVT